MPLTSDRLQAAAELWGLGHDTADIAKALDVPESDVWSSLDAIRQVRLGAEREQRPEAIAIQEG